MSACDHCAVRERAICADARRGRTAGAQRDGAAGARSAQGRSLIWEGDDSTLVGNVIGGVLKLDRDVGRARADRRGGLSVGLHRPAVRRHVTRAHGHRADRRARLRVLARRTSTVLPPATRALERKLLERTLDRARPHAALDAAARPQDRRGAHRHFPARHVAAAGARQRRGGAGRCARPLELLTFSAPAGRRCARADDRDRQPPFHQAQARGRDRPARGAARSRSAIAQRSSCWPAEREEGGSMENAPSAPACGTCC